MEKNENASTELLMSWMQSGGVISGGAMPSHADNKGLSAAAGSLQFLCPGQVSPSHADNKGLSVAGYSKTYTPYC